MGSSPLKDQTHVSVSPALAGRFFTTVSPGKPFLMNERALMILTSKDSWEDCMVNCFALHNGSLSLLTKLFSSVQSLSLVRLPATPWTAAHQASLSITNSQSPPKPMSIELMMPSNHLILCRLLLLLPSIFPSIRVFSNESVIHIMWPKYWSFSFSISPSNEYSGLLSFRMDWLDLLAVQGTLKSLLQHHSSKASILQCSAFFIVQLSHPYMTTGKIITTKLFTILINSFLFPR